MDLWREKLLEECEITMGYLLADHVRCAESKTQGGPISDAYELLARLRDLQPKGKGA